MHGEGRLGRYAALAGMALLAGTMLWTSPAAAQVDVNLQNRLIRLENDVQTLNRQVFRGGAVPQTGSGATGSGMPSSLAADFEVRLSRLEGELQTLTGKYEETVFGISQARERLDKLSSDLEYRLTEIESKLSAAPAAAENQPAPAPTKGKSEGKSETAAATPPKAPPAQPAQQQATAAAKLPTGSPQEQYDYAFGLLRAADYANAEVALGTFIKNHPDNSLTSNAHYWLGETYYVRGKYGEAAAAFAEGYQKFPKSSKAADNLLKLGMSLGQLNQKKEACLSFAELNNKFPDASATIKRRADQERGRLNCS